MNSKEIDRIISKDLDIINILKELQQLENMKRILLSPEQRKLLKFVKKPKIERKAKKSEFDITSAQIAVKAVLESGRSEISNKLVGILDPSLTGRNTKKKKLNFVKVDG